MVAANLAAVVANASRLGSNAEILLRALENRASLAALELEEARGHLTTAVMWGVASSIALLLAGVSLNLAIAAAFWDTPQRLTALLVLGAIEIAGAATGVWYVISRWQRWQLFEHSRDQLAKDSACLREILTPPRH